MKRTKEQSSLHSAILGLLQANPAGLDIRQIRERLRLGGTQQHLDRRVRDLDPYHVIDRVREGGKMLYVYKCKRKAGEWDYEDISKDTRARILIRDGRRCQMCGRCASEVGVKLHVDHKVPRSWGGETIDENLWTLCSACNEGKKNYYKTFDEKLMSDLLKISSVHERIATLLHLKLGEWVEADLLQFVANARDYQADWRKRLRELRYVKLRITMKRMWVGRRPSSAYKLLNWVQLPTDVSQVIRRYEIERARSNRSSKNKRKRSNAKYSKS
jgi:hypothetical protein